MMKMITPNTAAKSEAPIHFRFALERGPHGFFDASGRLSPDRSGPAKVRCSQPTRGILDRLFFAVQHESFSEGRLTLSAVLGAGNLVFREPGMDGETNAL